ncbi:MAG: nitroreductase family protein, partial [Collinsella sp.]|nr:nitroreductase family protein [Collinsella sp.]
MDLARSRYSCRLFEDRSVEQAVVDTIVEAGRIAPSACNNHPTRVMVLDTP